MISAIGILAIVCAMGSALIFVVGWRVAVLRDRRDAAQQDHSITIPTRANVLGGVGAPPLDLTAAWRVPLAPVVSRVPMHSRFVPVDEEPERASALADQIVHDQAVAHEEPGKEVTAPAPGEPGYQHPGQIVTVSVGKYTVHMMRDARPCLGEATIDGNEYPLVEIPEEWAEPLVEFAMEVLRLREGWTVG